MKKLMVALSAVALAFGVHAADDVTLPVGEYFNDCESALPSTITDDGGECSLSEVQYSYPLSGTLGFPNQWNQETLGKNMAVKTPLTTPAYYSMESAVTMEGLYFDSLVKFTACDEDAAIPDGSDAKLMVWLKENEAGTKTNLMVTAGYVLDEMGNVEPKIYDCGDIHAAPYNVGDGDIWCRLTIKAKKDITNGEKVPGFVVFVNGVAATITTGYTDIGAVVGSLNRVDAIWNEAHQLFPSLKADTTVSAVGFAGQGAVDDLSFTTAEPTDRSEQVEFAKDPVPAKVGLVIDGEQKDVKTIEDAVDVIKNISAQVETVALTLFEGHNGAITFEANENVGQIVLDLAGQTIEVGDTPDGTDMLVAVSSAIPMLITDSSTEQTGKIVAGEGSLAVSATAALEIDAGTFDGTVNVEGGASISGGAFASEDSEAFYLAESLAAGKTATYAEGYWTVADAPKKGWAIYLAEGDEENEFLISSENDLIALAANCNKDADFATAGIKFTQTAEITLTDTFPGIGAPNAKDDIKKPAEGGSETFKSGAFQGTYDGQNYAIKGLIIGLANKIDYIGLFNSCWNATIKDLQVGLGNVTGWADSTANQVGAVIAGVTGNTTIENVKTIVVGNNNTFKATKTAAGIVGYAAGGTVLRGCVNNLNIESVNNEKCAGLIACAQDTGAFGGGITIDGCENHGNVTCSKSGCERASLLVSYTDTAVTFQGNIVAEGTVTQVGGTKVQSVINLNDGSAAVAAGAVIKVPAAYKTVNQKAVDGLFFATVNGNVATLVKASALVVGVSYKVMAPGAAPVIVLGASEQITFDQTLATIDAAGITTSATGYEVTQEGNTYKATPKSYGITYAWVGVDAGDLEKIVNSNPTTYTFGTGVASFANASCEGYTFKGWNPTSIATDATDAKTIMGTFEKQSTWPAEWPDADDTVKAKFATWKSTYGVTTFKGNEAAFLLNVAPDAVKPLVIEEINVEDGVAKIVVSSEGADLGEINGILYVEAGDTLEEMAPKALAYWTTTAGKANVQIEANFIKAAIGFKKPADDAVQPKQD